MAGFLTVLFSCVGLDCVFLKMPYSAKLFNCICLGCCKATSEVVAQDSMNVVSIIKIDGLTWMGCYI